MTRPPTSGRSRLLVACRGVAAPPVRRFDQETGGCETVQWAGEVFWGFAKGVGQGVSWLRVGGGAGVDVAGQP